MLEVQALQDRLVRHHLVAMVQTHGIGRARVDEVIGLSACRRWRASASGGCYSGMAGTRLPGGGWPDIGGGSAGGRGLSLGDCYGGARVRDLGSDEPTCRTASGWAVARGDTRVVGARPQLDRAHGNSR
jgi:hypothetical protein